MRALWLPNRLRDHGVEVVCHPGWETRGRDTAAEPFDPEVAVCHHTAGPRNGNAPSLGICVEGRPGIPGPLCHVHLARNGVATVVASGKANHAGVGAWRGIRSSRFTMGVEAENDGQGEPWPARQLDAYHRVVAAMCDGAGIAVGDVIAHRDWALPPGRKTDPVGIDMGDFRSAVAGLLGRRPAAKDDPQPEEDDVRLPVLGEGDRSDTVETVQVLVNALVPTAGLAIDGAFGPRTKAAVGAFQGASGLAADGVVGPRTWAKLLQVA